MWHWLQDLITWRTSEIKMISNKKNNLVSVKENALTRLDTGHPDGTVLCPWNKAVGPLWDSYKMFKPSSMFIIPNSEPVHKISQFFPTLTQQFYLSLHLQSWRKCTLFLHLIWPCRWAAGAFAVVLAFIVPSQTPCSFSFIPPNHLQCCQ